MTEREFATDVVQRLQATGFTALFAGGCVRDELLGLTPADYDIATNATPEQVTQLFRRAHQFGASFGVVEVLGPRASDTDGWLKVQVATFRSDGQYSDGRRPDAVTFSSPEEDAQRRDFTVNGLFLDPLTGTVTDYVQGRIDLENRILRAIGDPDARFAEDKLRVLRAARMAARFGLSVDPATADAARRFAAQVTVVSAERIAEELRKMLAHPARSDAVQLCHDLNLTATLLPELLDTTGTRQRVLSYLHGSAKWVTAFACLFPPGVGIKPIADRLKLSNDDRDFLAFLTANRPVVLSADQQLASVLFPVLATAGSSELVLAARAEALGTGASRAGVERCEELLASSPAGALNPPPLLTGDDLRAAGFRPGPRFKPALAAARAAQLDGLILTRSEAEAVARQVLESPAS